MSDESVSPEVSQSAKMITKYLPHGSIVRTYRLPMSAEYYDIFPIQNFYPAGTHWNKYNHLGHEGFLECVPLPTTRGTTPHQVHISPTASTAPHSGQFLWKFSPFALFIVSEPIFEPTRVRCFDWVISHRYFPFCHKTVMLDSVSQNVIW